MNLLESQWIPVRRESGESYIAPWQLTEPDDSVLELAAPRPDFNGALLQFLIGLLQTPAPRRMAINGRTGWRSLLHLKSLNRNFSPLHRPLSWMETAQGLCKICMRLKGDKNPSPVY